MVGDKTWPMLRVALSGPTVSSGLVAPMLEDYDRLRAKHEPKKWHILPGDLYQIDCETPELAHAAGLAHFQFFEERGAHLMLTVNNNFLPTGPLSKTVLEEVRDKLTKILNAAE